jgi:hypothetical protein
MLGYVLVMTSLIRKYMRRPPIEEISPIHQDIDQEISYRGDLLS